MTGKEFHLEVVSVEKKIFVGQVHSLQVTSEQGELGILYGHLPLLAAIKPGILKILRADGTEDLLYISGGFLEVQKHHTTILADTVIRDTELDAFEAQKLKEEATRRLALRGTEVEHLRNSRDLAKALAKLRTVRLSKFTVTHKKYPRA